MEDKEIQTGFCAQCEMKKVSKSKFCPDCKSEMETYQKLINTQAIKSTTRIDHTY